MGSYCYLSVVRRVSYLCSCKSLWEALDRRFPSSALLVVAPNNRRALANGIQGFLPTI